MRTEPLNDVGYDNAIPDETSLHEALEVHHGFRGDEAAVQQNGAAAFWLTLADLPQAEEPAVVRNQEKKRWLTVMNADLERARSATWAATEGDLDEARAQCNCNNKVRMLEGPPGTGKTSVAKHFVQEAVNAGLSVLWAVYTAQLAARIRGEVDAAVTVATCHQAFCLGPEMAECAYNLVGYDVVTVDEFSQLGGQDFTHINQLRHAIDNAVAFGMLGGRFQLSGFGLERAWHTPAWKYATHLTNLHHLYRCKDPDFRRILNVLRTAKPTSTGAHGTVRVQDIMRHRRAWKGHMPKVTDIARLLKAHSKTTMMAVTRRGAQELNSLAVQAVFGGEATIASIPGDVESNPENHLEDGSMKPVKECKPLQLPCYVNMKVFFTKNVDKERDYINGMPGTVEAFLTGTAWLC